MTYTPTAVGPTTGSARSASTTAAIGVAAVVTPLTLWGAHDLREVGIVLGVAAVVIAGVYGLLVPAMLRRDSAAGAALTLSVIGVLLVLPAFWSGLPLVLGVAGAMLGYAGRRTVAGKAALVLGVLSSLAYLAIYASEFYGI